jgi:hypothetical protein
LQSGPQCQCVVATRDNVVTIAPARPHRVYLPVYDPGYVYGAWPYPLYPPVVFPLPVGFAFAPGYYWGYYDPVSVAAYWPLWGWGWFNWSGHNVLVDSRRVAAITGVAAAGFATGVWARNAAHGSAVVGGGPTGGRMGAAAMASGRAAWRGGAAAASSRGGWHGENAAWHHGGGYGGHFAHANTGPHGFGHGMAGGFHDGGGGHGHGGAGPHGFGRGMANGFQGGGGGMRFAAGAGGGGRGGSHGGGSGGHGHGGGGGHGGGHGH